MATALTFMGVKLCCPFGIDQFTLCYTSKYTISPVARELWLEGSVW